MGEVYDAHKSEQFLGKFVQVAKGQLVKEASEIKINVPLVLKIVSPDAIHKSDVGGVEIVRSKDELESSFNRLVSISKKRKLKLRGILAQKFYEGQEVIIGIKKDETFGHVILLGLGGIFTEVLEDTSIRKCPISKEDAEEMISELKAHKVFEGFRGKKLDADLLKKTLVKVSEIPIKYKKIKELDINPFILDEKSGTAVDARIVFD